jgi:hypothetical protein
VTGRREHHGAVRRRRLEHGRERRLHGRLVPRCELHPVPPVEVPGESPDGGQANADDDDEDRGSVEERRNPLDESCHRGEPFPVEVRD